MPLRPGTHLIHELVLAREGETRVTECRRTFQIFKVARVPSIYIGTARRLEHKQVAHIVDTGHVPMIDFAVSRASVQVQAPVVYCTDEICLGPRRKGHLAGGGPRAAASASTIGNVELNH